MWLARLLLLGLLDLASALDAYCGIELHQAAADCVLECQDDSECKDLGPDYLCFMFTGCTEKLVNHRTLEVQQPGTNSSIFDADTNSTAFDTDDDMNSTLVDADSNSPMFNADTNEANATVTIAPTDPPVKTKRPTSSPTPNPYLASLKTAARREINGNAGSTTTTSYGFIFNMRTTAESAAVHIIGFDFLTASTSDLDFELYSTPGSYTRIKGKYGRWIMMGKGTVKGQGTGSLTSITSDLITPIPMDGQGSTRAFYLSLSTKDMITRVTSTGSAADEMVQQATDEVHLYEGESVNAFPFPAETDGAYAGPHQFIGAIHYDTVPCKPFEAQGYIYTLPCPVIPTISPVPSTIAPTTLSPTISRTPSMVPTYEVTPEPSYMPTTQSPTLSSPPTVPPTRSPVNSIPIEVNIVLTLRNVVNRNMTTQEEEFFIYELLEFFFLNSPENVRVNDAKVWYQQRVNWVDRKSRRLQGLGSQELASRAVTVILQVAFLEAGLAESEVGRAVVDALQQSKEDLVISLRGGDASYFMQIDAIQAEAIERATLAPVATPNFLAETKAVESSSNVGVYAGVGVGVFALCFVAIGLSYHFIKKSHIEKGFQRGSTNSLGSHDIETGQLPPSDTVGAVPKFISPIDDDVESDSEGSGSAASQGSHSEAEADEKNSQASHTSANNAEEDHPLNQSDVEESPESTDDVPGESISSAEGDAPVSKQAETFLAEPKKKDKEKRKSKKSESKKKKATKKRRDSNKSREKEPVDTDKAIASIIASNQATKSADSSDDFSSDDSSSSESDSSQSSAPKPKKHWKALQNAVKSGEVTSSQHEGSKSKPAERWKKLSTAVQNGEVTVSETKQEASNNGSKSKPAEGWKKLSTAVKNGEVTGSEAKPRSSLQKKDNWKTLSQSVNAGKHAPSTAKKAQHRSRSLVITSSDAKHDKDGWGKLSKAVKAKEFANSDSNLIRRSQTKSASNMHASESNLDRASMRRSATQKDDNWKSLRQLVKAGEHRSSEAKTHRRSMLVDVNGNDDDARGSSRHQPSTRKSSRAISRDGASDMRRSSRDASANALRSSKRQERSDTLKRSSSSSKEKLRRSSSGADEMRRSSRHLQSNELTSSKTKTMDRQDEMRRSSRNLSSRRLASSDEMKRSTPHKSDDPKRSRHKKNRA